MDKEFDIHDTSTWKPEHIKKIIEHPAFEKYWKQHELQHGGDSSSLTPLRHSDGGKKSLPGAPRITEDINKPRMTTTFKSFHDKHLADQRKALVLDEANLPKMTHLDLTHKLEKQKRKSYEEVLKHHGFKPSPWIAAADYFTHPKRKIKVNLYRNGRHSIHEVDDPDDWRSGSTPEELHDSLR